MTIEPASEKPVQDLPEAMAASAAPTEARAGDADAGDPKSQPLAPSAPDAPPPARKTRKTPNVSLDEHELRSGMVLKSRFTLFEELGAGGMGRVYKAHDRLMEEARDRNPFVALKVLSNEFKRHPDSFIALQREARRAQTLAHPNVVTVYNFDRDGPYVFFTMEYLQGHPLDLLLKSDLAGGLPMERAWPIIRSIGLALQYGHEKGVVHCDLKPGNVFVCADGTVKVLDFGISRPMVKPGRESEQTSFDPAKRLGGLTPAYASLEMWKREAPDPRDDIYAFACLAYELLTGQHPFARGSAVQAYESRLRPARISSLSRRQWETLRRSLAFLRQDRTVSVKEFLDALAPLGWWKRYNKMIAVGVAAVAAVGILISARYYRDYVEREMLSEMGALPTRAAVNLSDEQKSSIESSLLLAEDYLSDLKGDLSSDDLAYILSEGPNNVNQIVDSVLAIDPANKQALKIKHAIADAYARKARQLIDRKDDDAALRMIRDGLAAAPKHRDLYRLQREACRGNPRLCGS